MTPTRGPVTIIDMVRTALLSVLVALSIAACGGAGGTYDFAAPDAGEPDAQEAEQQVGPVGEQGREPMPNSSSSTPAVDAGAKVDAIVVVADAGPTPDARVQIVADAGSDAAEASAPAPAVEAGPVVVVQKKCTGTAICATTVDNGKCNPVGCETATLIEYKDGTWGCIDSVIGVVQCAKFGNACGTNFTCEQLKSKAECLQFDSLRCAWSPSVSCTEQPTPCDRVSVSECEQRPGCTLR